MNRLTHKTHLISFWLFLSCLMTTVYAGDEDMNPTAYQRFDPETGFMIPIQQPHDGQQQNHNQTTQGTTDAVQTPDTSMPPPVVEAPAESTSFWLYLLAGVTVLAGLAAWIRGKKVRTTSSHLD